MDFIVNMKYGVCLLIKVALKMVKYIEDKLMLTDNRYAQCQEQATKQNMKTNSHLISIQECYFLISLVLGIALKTRHRTVMKNYPLPMHKNGFNFVHAIGASNITAQSALLYTNDD